MSILVVDDSQDARNVLESLLKDSGYEDVTTADCAEDAYGMLGLQPTGVDDGGDAGEPIELILMDIDMPHTDELEACRRIKESERLREVPVIFVTGKTDPRSVRAAFSAGAADFLPKPVRRSDLLASMGSILGRPRRAVPRKNPPRYRG